ncbi:uncharacterized protein N7477_006735 [Penicillium maclennaniae]|uniref:uncharacterized protein n=1 Tax=Penicillium maclennaniae TaxID=1343394 RepID=UPI002540AE81|nr:uncharacterized protein N7477_006735 [Penicillium maclennaniae]KAJ5668165.1 hypothetical protein N7477_006735 [Penicillium maclennaniae]
METLRDTAFGKLVRLCTRYQCMQYPEKQDASVWTGYLKTENTESKLEPSTTLNESENPEDLEAFGLYTVRSQISTRSRRMSCASTVQDDNQNRSNDQALVISWRGPDDSENPQNWSITKKALVSGLIWLLTFAIYVGSSIYTPGIPGVTQQFGVSSVAAVSGLTLFVLGYELDQTANVLQDQWSGLLFRDSHDWAKSNIRLDASRIRLLPILGVIYAQNFGMLLAFRFLTGFVGSLMLAISAASMGDIWSPKVRDYMIGIWGMFAISAPVLGPMLGGFAASAKGWTWTIWQLLWVSEFTLVLLFLFLPETFTPNILARRARRVRRITGNSRYMSESEIEIREIKPMDVLFEALVRPFQLCFLEPIVFLLNSLYLPYLWHPLCLVRSLPNCFRGNSGFNPGESGLAFMGFLVSTCCITIPGYFYWKYYYQSRHFDKDGNIAPEYQMSPACVGAFALPISLFRFGWTGNFESVHWIVPIIASILFAFGGVFDLQLYFLLSCACISEICGFGVGWE